MNNKELQEIIDSDFDLILREAWKAYVPGYKDGLGCVDINTGRIFGNSLAQGERNVLEDSEYVEVYRFDAETPRDYFSFWSYTNYSQEALESYYPMEIVASIPKEIDKNDPAEVWEYMENNYPKETKEIEIEYETNAWSSFVGTQENKLLGKDGEL